MKAISNWTLFSYLELRPLSIAMKRGLTADFMVLELFSAIQWKPTQNWGHEGEEERPPIFPRFVRPSSQKAGFKDVWAGCCPIQNGANCKDSPTSISGLGHKKLLLLCWMLNLGFQNMDHSELGTGDRWKERRVRKEKKHRSVDLCHDFFFKIYHHHRNSDLQNKAKNSNSWWKRRGKKLLASAHNLITSNSSERWKSLVKIK